MTSRNINQQGAQGLGMIFPGSRSFIRWRAGHLSAILSDLGTKNKLIFLSVLAELKDWPLFLLLI